MTQEQFYKEIREQMTSKESCNNVVKNVAIKFAKFRIGTMSIPEKEVDGKAIIRENPDDYWEELFNEFIKSL